MDDEPNQSQIVEIQGESLTPLDRFWLDTARNAAKESISALEDAAKQLITITSLSQTIYFAAISFSNVKKGLEQFTPTQLWPIALLLAFPLLFWIAGLWFAIRVFKPETYRTNLNSPDIARKTYKRIVAYKHKQLRRAHFSLVMGFIPLLINVIAYLLLVPPPAS